MSAQLEWTEDSASCYRVAHHELVRLLNNSRELIAIADVT
jgi:hypothetical protein